jgi:Domain of unknown function (DUF4333)
VVPQSSPRERPAPSPTSCRSRPASSPRTSKCPSGVDAEVGKEFECHFTGPAGKDYTAHMRVTKVDGDDVQFYIKTAPS